MKKVFIKAIDPSMYRPNEIAEIINFGNYYNYDNKLTPHFEVKYGDGEIDLIPLTEYIFLYYVFMEDQKPSNVSANNKLEEQRKCSTIHVNG